MAAVNTIDMSRQMFIGKDESVESSVPLACHAGYTIPGFHNRSSSLFPSTQNNTLFNQTNIKTDDKGDNLVNLYCFGKPPSAQTLKSARVQSAQSRLEKSLKNRIDVSNSLSLKSKSARPNSSCTNRLRAPRPPSATTEKVPVHKARKTTEQGKKSRHNHNVTQKLKNNEHLRPEDLSISKDADTEDNRLQTSFARTNMHKEQNLESELENLDVNRNNSPLQSNDMSLVPVGGQPVPVVDIGYEAPFPTYDYQTPHYTKHMSTSDTVKPFLPPSASDKVTDFYAINKTEKSSSQSAPDTGLKPSIYGFNKNRHVYGSNPDLSQSEISASGFPYKLSTQDDLVNGMKALPNPTTDNKVKERSLPENLEPLRPWLTDSVNEDLTGVNPNTCSLVFLPSLLDRDLSDLPEVPAPHSLEEDLPYKERVPPPEVFAPKKYDHPAFNHKPVEEWVCKHSRPHSRIYSDDGQLLHERFQGQRTISIIRKEIAELENLLKGIGTKNSDCSVVKYQAEIDYYRSLHLDTMSLIPDRLLHSPKPVDTFGLRKFYREHDEVVQQITRQHALCLQELAVLEAEVGILSDRKYFKHQISNKPD